MFYISYNDLVNDIKSNLYKIREEEKNGQFCRIIGIPRSGMIAALIISEYLNIGVSSLDNFINTGGGG